MPALSWPAWLTRLPRDLDRPPEPDTPQPDNDETEEVVPDGRT